MAGSVSIIEQKITDRFSLYNGDCIDVARGLPDDSLHYTIFSPPFESLYTFSDDPRDMSNCADSGTFWAHFGFLVEELFRATMPGRLCSIHCMQLPTSKLRDGFIGLRDFRGEVIRAFQEVGFIYHSEVCIRKDPVSAMQRSKSIGLLHKQVVKDSALSRMAVADYVVTMRKPGDNPEPIAGAFGAYHGTGPVAARAPEQPETGHVASSYSVQVWQRYAEPVWMDIAQSDVLSHRVARDEADERHISPLQLTVIRRCVDLWSNPGDVVFTPFMGIGSEVYVAVEQGRRGLGVELKPSYFRQAVANLDALCAKPVSIDMMAGIEVDPATVRLKSETEVEPEGDALSKFTDERLAEALKARDFRVYAEGESPLDTIKDDEIIEHLEHRYTVTAIGDELVDEGDLDEAEVRFRRGETSEALIYLERALPEGFAGLSNIARLS